MPLLSDDKKKTTDDATGGWMGVSSWRVLQMVEVSTSMCVVRYLSEHLEDWMGPLDTCLYSVVVVACTQVLGMGGLAWAQPYGLLGLSRRVSLLLLVEKMRPFVQTWATLGDGRWGGDAWAPVESVLGSGLVLTATALVPPELSDTEEGEVILTAVRYMYADVFGFAVRLWPDMRLAVLGVAATGLCWLGGGGGGDKEESRLWAALRDVGSVACANLAVSVLACEDRGAAGPWAQLMHLLLVMTMVHSATAFAGVARTAQEYLVYMVSAGIADAVSDGLPGGGGADALVVGGAAWCLYCVWPGPRAWISQCMLLAFVNVLVASALAYIRRLAAHDTFITLKTSAVVLHFLLHEAVVWARGDGSEDATGRM